MAHGAKIKKKCTQLFKNVICASKIPNDVVSISLWNPYPFLHLHWGPHARHGVSITGHSSCFCSIAGSSWQHKQHQSPHYLSFFRGIPQWPVSSSHKGPAMRKRILVMILSCYELSGVPFTNMDPLILARISNHMPSKMWEEITYPIPTSTVHHWSLLLYKYFHRTLQDGCDYLPMLGLTLIHNLGPRNIKVESKYGFVLYRLVPELRQTTISYLSSWLLIFIFLSNKYVCNKMYSIVQHFHFPWRMAIVLVIAQ